MKPSDLPGRLAGQVVIGDQGCWLWRGYVLPSGYVQTTLRGTRGRVHRLVYAALVAPIPEGMEVDHLCHNRDADCPGGRACLHRRCFNPAHLEATTSQTNILRSRTTLAGINARLQECWRGHPFNDANTYIRTDRHGRVHRQCRVCESERKRRAA